MSEFKLYILQIATAFFGAMGFSLLYNTRRTKMLISALGGALGWTVFTLVKLYAVDSELFCLFAAAMAVTVYAEIFARIKKTPTTTFLVVGIISMIPGSALYYTMSYAVGNDLDKFLDTGVYTLKSAMALAVGIIVVSTAVRMASAVVNHFYKKKKGTEK